MCKEVINCYCARFAVLLTETASDTSDLTYIHQCFSLFIGIALYNCFLFVRNQLNQVLRTGCHTFAAGFAGFLIYHCDSVYNMNRIKRTGIDTGSVPETSVCTSFCTAVLHLACHNAVFDAVIFIFCFCFLAGSSAFHKSDISLLLGSIYSHNCTNLFSYGGTSDRASADLGLSGHNGRCQTGAAGIAAAATVVTRQNFQYCVFTLICFYCKFLSCYSEEDSDEQAGAADYDRARAERCLRDAGFGDRLDAMPKGLDTYLYKDLDKEGVEISGGEAQKIAIARALYKDAPFLVLDEPTAALDPIAEAEVYASFDAIAGDKTALYISHRLSSCKFCDAIAVFDGGAIVQTGSHDALVADEEGLYHQLWQAQAQYYTNA